MHTPQPTNPKSSRWMRRASAAVALLLASAAAVASDQTDHPLVSRVPGVALLSKEVRQFDVVKASVAGHLPDGRNEVVYEGRVTTIEYGTLKGDPPGELKIYRSHLAAAKQAGGRQLNAGFDASDPVGLVTGAHVFTLSAAPQSAVAVLNITNAYNYELRIIEPATTEKTARAGDLADQLKKSGVATLHINFDTAKAQLKDDGRAIVQEIAMLLKRDPALRLSIEGHTDNVGPSPRNKRLSQARAEAVMKAVAAQGIDRARLSAAGYGDERPVAENTTEAGRSQNRRVELVQVQ